MTTPTQRQTVTSDADIRPFRIEVPQTDLDDLRERLGRTRWPEELPGVGWEDGVPLSYLKGLAEYWRASYDWRRHEARLNGFSQFITTIDGHDVHFLHVRPPEPDAVPLIITHGWPGSIEEFTEIVGPLADPRAHGGDPVDAFHVVAPSVPGFGFCGRPRETGWNLQRITAAFAELMHRLGYERYGAHGGDFGSMVSPELGRLYPDRVIGVHVKGLLTSPPRDPAQLAALTDDERDRMTINAGVRFDHNRAFSPDVHVVNAQGVETDAIIRGAGTLYTWNIVSPRLGVTTKLSADGRTMLRASYGRFSQGVLTGEIGTFHPGVTPITTTAFESATGGYTRPVSVVDPRINLLLDRDTRAPHTDEYSLGVDREIDRRLAVAAAYVHKDGANFVGWTDIGGQYGVETRSLPDRRRVPVFVLLNETAARRFFLTNTKEYSLTYNGLVMLVEKRRSHGWQAFASYTVSKTTGLLPSSGTNAAGAQVSTVSQPTTPRSVAIRTISLTQRGSCRTTGRTSSE